MQPNQSRRGRPRGSGIDDSRLLREIAAMMIDDPQLKPTTAIKNTGISDPSIIRRLRDKFKGNKDALMRELQPQNTSEYRHNRTENKSVPSSQPFSETRTMALKHPREPSRSEPVKGRLESDAGRPEATEPDDGSRRTGIDNDTKDFTTRRMLTDSLRTASAIWQLQLYLASQTIQSPIVRSLIYYQLAFSQAMLGLGGPEPSARIQQ